MADLMTYCEVILSDHHQKEEVARDKRFTIFQSNLQGTCKLNTKHLPYIIPLSSRKVSTKQMFVKHYQPTMH